MACPFLRDPIDIGAQIVRKTIRTKRLFKDRQNPLSFSEEYINERYHFSSHCIVYLADLLTPSLRNDTLRSYPLTVMQTLCIGLHFFACGEFMHAVGDAENLSKSTVCRAIRRVYLALARILPDFVKFPGHCSQQEVKDSFYRIAGLPNVIGVVDCTHIPIKVPSGPEASDYTNQRSFHSINVQMVCDSQCLITNIEAKWPGSVNDFHILQKSTLYHQFQQGIFDGWLVADNEYPCLPFMMTPYLNPKPGAESCFNEALYETRACIKTTFTTLRARFGCLKGLWVSPQSACDIIVACMVLHNVAIIRKEAPPCFSWMPRNKPEPVYCDHQDGTAIRDSIAAQLFASCSQVL
ncbi:putative nuclease HARBI1 [Coregonus clupeaformis]|uniref:putative nuclease HARBI1 n=1 Tax=Coregonus clupeaformis TaxID=59861 RepID=UPI001BDFA0EE|nr:putative nuclease HARBI1 [Coregonus clupeaformis]